MKNYKKATLPLRWAQIRCCTSPNITPHNSESEEENNEKDADNNGPPCA